MPPALKRQLPDHLVLDLALLQSQSLHSLCCYLTSLVFRHTQNVFLEKIYDDFGRPFPPNRDVNKERKGTRRLPNKRGVNPQLNPIYNSPYTRPLKFTMKSISKGFIKKKNSQGGNLAKTSLAKQEKGERNRKREEEHLLSDMEVMESGAQNCSFWLRCIYTF
jgi:hypothetical protein